MACTISTIRFLSKIQILSFLTMTKYTEEDPEDNEPAVEEEDSGEDSGAEDGPTMAGKFYWLVTRSCSIYSLFYCIV